MTKYTVSVESTCIAVHIIRVFDPEYTWVTFLLIFRGYIEFNEHNNFSECSYKPKIDAQVIPVWGRWQPYDFLSRITCFNPCLGENSNISTMFNVMIGFIQ